MHYELNAEPGSYGLEGKSVSMERLIFSRPAKLTHADTVRYEINMLRYAVGELADWKLQGRGAWIYLEAFLLHYRNLNEFLGREKPRDGDLHVKNVWDLEGLNPPQNLDNIHEQGTVLWNRYEPKKEQGGVRISQYLHHCTTKRTDAKDWTLATMMAEIEPLLSELEKHLGPDTGILEPVPARQYPSLRSASTTTVTIATTTPLVRRVKELE